MSTILEEHTELGVYRRIKSCVFIEEHTELSVYRRTQELGVYRRTHRCL